jgi:Spy/CpxP family protein refolding chaperone
MVETRKFVGLALVLGACLGGLGLENRAVAQDWKPGPPPMERSFQGQGRMHGRWWNDPKLAQQIGLTADQQKKMDDIMQQHRLKLIDLNANLQKQETIMQPLMEADQPDEGKILAQIDAIAQARAELEKGNARMLLGIRQVLTPDQWKKLKELRADRARNWGRDGRDGNGGHGGWDRRGPGGPDGPQSGTQPAPPPQMQ